MSVKKLEKMHADAAVLALQILKSKVRAAIRRNKSLSAFVMKGGECYFTDKRGDRVYLKGTLSVEGFVQEWDPVFQLTRMPVRITAEGPIETDW
jgi:hypothetical protein